MGYQATQEEAPEAYLFMRRGDQFEVGRDGTAALALFQLDRSTGHARISLGRVVEWEAFVPTRPDQVDMRQNVGPRQSLVFAVEGLPADQVQDLLLRFGGMVLDVVDAHAAENHVEEAVSV